MHRAFAGHVTELKEKMGSAWHLPANQNRGEVVSAGDVRPSLVEMAGTRLPAIYGAQSMFRPPPGSGNELQPKPPTGFANPFAVEHAREGFLSVPDFSRRENSSNEICKHGNSCLSYTCMRLHYGEPDQSGKCHLSKREDRERLYMERQEMVQYAKARVAHATQVVGQNRDVMLKDAHVSIENLVIATGAYTKALIKAEEEEKKDSKEKFEAYNRLQGIAGSVLDPRKNSKFAGLSQEEQDRQLYFYEEKVRNAEKKANDIHEKQKKKLPPIRSAKPEPPKKKGDKAPHRRYRD